MKGFKEILLISGLVCFLIGVIVLLQNEWQTREEAFQAAAGSMQIQPRGNYDRSIFNKETIPFVEVDQTWYTPAIIGRPNAKPMQSLSVIAPNAGAPGGRPGSEGYGPTLNFSGIEVFQGGAIKCPGGTYGRYSGKYDHSSCGGSWCHNVGVCPNATPKNRGWPDIYHSDDWNGYHWVDMYYPSPQLIDKIVFYNRSDWTKRAESYEIRVHSTNNTGRDIWPIFRFQLNSGLEQTFTINLDCPAGYTLTGDKYDVNTKCRQNCASGETFANGRCYRPCPSGTTLVGGVGGKCRSACQPGYTASGIQCYKNCIAPDIDAGNNQCYKPCAANEDDARPPKCYRACPSTHRLIVPNADGKASAIGDDNCYPVRPEDYLPVAWRGAILSQADPTVGLTTSLGKANGAAIGMWGTIGSSASENGSDHNWVYTETMELINLFNRKCLDWGSLNGNGPPVFWDCHGGNNQKWFIDSESRIRALNDKTMCLTVTDITTTPLNPVIDKEPKVRININSPLRLQSCTKDGTKLQRFFTNGNRPLAGLRVSLNGMGDAASAPPTLPEPINREGFLAERNDDDAF